MVNLDIVSEALEGDLIANRLYIEAILKIYRDVLVQVDLDSYTTINLIDISFVRKHYLQWNGSEALLVQGLSLLYIKTYRVFNVPLSLQDRYQVVRVTKIPCIIVNWFYKDSSILLGMFVLS